MADEKSKKRNLIVISSSEEYEPESGSEPESESSPPESDEDFVERTSSSTFCDDDEDDAAGSDWIDSENEEDDEAEVGEDEDCADKDDVESMCNKVIQMIRGRSDLQELKLVECKAYLRRHGLRLSGTKEECIERIKEHWRIKDGNGEAYYPRSSFKIDCTGDVCKGDVVLFNQKVHQITNKMTRSRSLRRRTVAGRIVKESYGASKQQHTFTVEVLWSKGAKRLNPLTPLLVKGRNLYKMKTHRQRWKNEKERLKVLSEKHKRGDAARTIRAMRHKKAATRTEKPIVNNRNPKHRKHSHHLGPSTTRATTHKYPNERRKEAKNMKSNPRPNSSPFETSSRLKNLVQSNYVRDPPGLTYNFPAGASNHFQSDVFPREMHHFPSHRGFVSTPRLPYPEKAIPTWKEFSRGSYDYPGGYSHSTNSQVSRNSNCFPRLMDDHPSFYHDYPGGYSHSTNSQVSRNSNCFHRLMDDHPSFYPSTTDTYGYKWR